MKTDPRPRQRTEVADWLVAHDPLPVSIWRDPLIDAHGYDVRSAYAERYWLATVGPTALLAARAIVTHIATTGGLLPRRIAKADLAAQLGVGHGGVDARNSMLHRALRRLVDLEMATIRDGTKDLHEALLVREMWPPLAGRHIRRLPDQLARELRDEPF